LNAIDDFGHTHLQQFSAMTDMFPTSAKLRLAAISAVKELRRPIAAHELERWIAIRDPSLWNEISKKCYDYVRIILSITTDNSIIKYKHNTPFPGIDCRSGFFGLPDGHYDPLLWTPISSGKRRARRHAPAPMVAHVPQMEAPGRPRMVVERKVEGITCEKCWARLMTTMPSKEPFWMALVSAIDAVNKKTAGGKLPAVAVQEVISEHQVLAGDGTIGDVINILISEATTSGLACR
jgi:hypothetical protein